mgnify:CR=1 FL=1
MSDEGLRRSLAELHAELDRLKEEEEADVRARLDRLAAAVETRLDRPDDATHHHSLLSDLRESVL